MERGCGIFMPISALPEKSGFGTFSKSAYDFIDYLSETGVKYWQVSPILENCGENGEIEYVSSFAIDPMLIDAERYLEREEIEFFKMDNYGTYEEFKEKKSELLNYLFDKLYFETNLDKFIEDNKDWIYDYAVFKVLKDELKISYNEFPDYYKNVDSGETISFIKTHSEEIVYYIFLQMIATKQWRELKKYAQSKGIKIISTTEIFSSANSADVYSNKNNYILLDGKIVGLESFYEKEQGNNQNNNEMGSKTTFLNLKNKNNIAMFNFDYAKQTKFAFLIQKFKWLSKLYDYVIACNFNDFEYFFKSQTKSLKLNSEVSGLSSSKNESLRIYNMKNYDLNSNFVENKNQDNSKFKELKNEFLEVLKENKIKNIIFDESENYESEESEKFEASKNLNIKSMELAILKNSEISNLPIHYDKNTIAYLQKCEKKGFKELLSDDVLKSRICSYLMLPIESEDEQISHMAMENLISSDAGVVILSAIDIFKFSSENENCEFEELRVSENYREEKFMKYLKELIKNKNR